MKVIGTVLLFYFCLVNTLAQDYTLKGKLVDPDNVPIEMATIAVYQSTVKISQHVSHAAGDFSISLPKGTYELTFDFFGTHKQQRTINLSKNINLGSITLGEKDNLVDEVVVTEKKKLLEYKLDKKIYNVSEDKTLVGANSLDALDKTPSVNVDIEGNISLRGDEGVTILVNGKPSSLVSTDNTNFLRSLPADAIERIEVITIPSARYDAEGSSGIINIIMKKGVRNNFNGSVTVQGGYPSALGLSANFNYKTNYYNVYTTIGLNHRSGEGSSKIYNQFFDSNNSLNDQVSESSTTQIRETQGLFLNTGLDYYLTPSDILNFEVGYGKRLGEDYTDVSYDDYLLGSPNNHALSWRNEIEEDDDVRYESNLSYTHQFKKKEGHQLYASAKYDTKLDHEIARIIETSSSPTAMHQQTLSDNKDVDYILQIDYTLPLGKDGSFELGYKYNQTDLLNKYVAQTLENDIWQPIPEYTHDFAYHDNIHSTYTQYGNKIGHFSFLAGLRVEKTEISMKNVVIDNVFHDEYTKHYTDFFPSAHLNYELNENNAIQLGYSKRLHRPRHRMLNPFFTLSDDRNIFSGNPDLDPMYTQSSELSYLYNASRLNTHFAVYYNYSTNPFQYFSESYLDPSSGEEIIRSYPVNLDHEQRYGAELGVRYNWFKALQLSSEFNYFSYSREGIIIDINGTERNQEGEGNSFSAKAGIDATLPYKIGLQLKANYHGSMQNSESQSNPMYKVDLALSKDFFNKQLAVNFSIRDLLDSQKRRRETITDTYYSKSEYRRNVRQFNLSASYYFGTRPKKRKPKSENESSPSEDNFDL